MPNTGGSTSTPGEGPGLFPVTRWSLIQRMQEGDEPTRQQSMDVLCRTYWRPVYAWLRARGSGPEDAEDTVQDFFVRMVQGDWLAGVDRQKGRLRSLLLVMLKRHAANAHEARCARKRGGGVDFVPFDAAEAEHGWSTLPSDGAPPDVAFDREWARQLLERVMSGLRDTYEKAGKAALFDELRDYLAGGSAEESYAESARRLGMPAGTLKVAAFRLRERYRQRLREAVLETVNRPEEVDPELQALFRVFSSPLPDA